MASSARLVFETWTDPVAGELLAAEPGIEVIHLDIAGDADAAWATLTDAHGYHVATRTACALVESGEQWLAGPELIARCPALLAVCSAGAGYDVIDVEACTAAGVVVCNNSGPGAEAVAEHALALMLAVAKRIVLGDRTMRRETVRDRLPLRGIELLGKTLGVVGLGAIGSRLVELCGPFHMEVLVHDPFVDRRKAEELGVRLVGLDELLVGCDVVQVTCPLTPATAGLFGREAFALMSPSSIFVTTARGQVHDEDALFEALTTGGIAGAGIDVFHAEPVPHDHPLLALDNVVATPHVGGITVEATRAIGEATGLQWAQVFRGEVPPRLVNPEAWPRYQDRYEATFGTRPPDLDGGA